MIGAAGLTATLVALGAAVIGLFLSVRAARRRSFSVRLVQAVTVTALSGLLANGLMIVALVTRDFSVAYVAQVGSRTTPLMYTIASLWGALEGSILFWAGLLGAYALLLARRTRGPAERYLPVALAVLFCNLVFFWAIVAGPGNPWGRVWPIPPDGPGPNPLLQNHPLMAVHPPLVYLGFVGLAVPFAMTIAALVDGSLDRVWLAAARGWTLVPWVALTAGLVLGSWWSYAVLGWGGYWAWDPVENVALLPWLTATAFLHSAMIQERRGSLLTWNVALVIASFCLTLLATLVTRSGILASVHSFTQSAIGPLFLALLSAAIAGSILLTTWRLTESQEARPLGSRGVAFLANNVLLVAIAVTVMLGTLYPLVVEALSGDRISVGAPYFDRVVGPVALGLLVLLGIGPSLPWGAWHATVRRQLWPGAVGAAIGAVALAARAAPPEQVLGTAAASFALVQSLVYAARRLGRWPRDRALVNRRRATQTLGALLAHGGVALVALVIVSSAAGRQQGSATLRPGEVLAVGGYQVRFLNVAEETAADRSTVRASVVATGPGVDQSIAPALTRFGLAPQSIPTPAIVSTPAADLYVTLLRVDPLAGTAALWVDIRPFMSWFWLGGLVAAAGGLVAAAAAARTTERVAIAAPGTLAAQGPS